MTDIRIDHSIIDAIKPAKLKRKRARAWDDTLYSTALEWMSVADATFQQWPARPNCGHFYGGSYWYGSETAHTVLCLAVVASVGPFDAAAAGVERQQLIDHAIAGIRYLGFTHDSGPEDCVRVAGPNPHASGRKWGGKGDAFFQASQHGTPVAALCQGAWLLWDQLDDETRQLIVNALTTYADTWCDEPARSGVYVDTQTEENGWTGQAIGLAAMMMPHHPRAEQWKAGADRWIANVCTTPYDRIRNQTELQGKPVAQWVQTVTTHPDFTAENHDFVHPNYMGSGITHAAMYAQYCLHAGARVPDVVRFNREPLYDVLKSFAEPDGSLTPLQGQDWWYVTHYGLTLLHAAMNTLFEDPEAAYLERCVARTSRDISASVGGGHLYIRDPGNARLNEFQSMRTAERGSVAALARAYLLHCQLGDGADPVTRAQFEKARRGVRTYPHGGLATRRGKDTVASFSWRNRPMVLVQPAGRCWDITPWPYSLVGSFRTEPQMAGGVPDAQCKVSEDGEMLAATMAMEREGGLLRQDVALVVPDDAVAFYFDRVAARDHARIIQQRRGEVSVRNEDYAELGARAPGRRRLWTAQGEVLAQSRFGGEDEWFRWPRSTWINLDDRIGYVVFGGAGIAYQACHDYPRYRGLEDYLILSYDDKPRDVEAGRQVSSLAVAIAPSQTHAATEQMAADVIRPRTPAHADALVAGDWLAVVNFARRRRTLKLSWDAGEEVAVFAGRTTLESGRATLEVSLAPFTATALKALTRVPASGTMSIVGAASGEAFVSRGADAYRLL